MNPFEQYNTFNTESYGYFVFDANLFQQRRFTMAKGMDRQKDSKKQGKSLKEKRAEKKAKKNK